MGYHYKSIKFSPDDHQIIAGLAKDVQHERGTPNAYLPPIVMEAVKFFKEHRNNPYIPKGKDDVARKI
jgi:hypothetical protein